MVTGAFLPIQAIEKSGACFAEIETSAIWHVWMMPESASAEQHRDKKLTRIKFFTIFLHKIKENIPI